MSDNHNPEFTIEEKDKFVKAFLDFENEEDTFDDDDDNSSSFVEILQTIQPNVFVHGTTTSSGTESLRRPVNVGIAAKTTEDYQNDYLRDNKKDDPSYFTLMEELALAMTTAKAVGVKLSFEVKM